MSSWIITHIDPLPDFVVSRRNKFEHLRVSLMPNENNLMKSEDQFYCDSKQVYLEKLKSKEGLLIESPKTKTFRLRLKGLFRKKLIIEFDETKYSGMKIS